MVQSSALLFVHQLCDIDCVQARLTHGMYTTEEGDLHAMYTTQQGDFQLHTVYMYTTQQGDLHYSYTRYVHYITGRLILQLHTVCTLHNRETYSYTTVTHGMYTTEQGDLQLHTVCTWNLQDILT